MSFAFKVDLLLLVLVYDGVVHQTATGFSTSNREVNLVLQSDR